MKVSNTAKYKIKNGYPVLIVNIDGKEVVINYEQRRLDDGLVFLGPQFETTVSAKIIPADPGDGRTEPLRVRGFSNDPDLLALCRKFLSDLLWGTFKPGSTISI